MNKWKLADERLLKEQCKKISTSAMIKKKQQEIIRYMW